MLWESKNKVTPFFLVAGDSSYTNHKFSALVCVCVFFSFKVTIYSVLLESHNKITLVNMHKNRTQPKTLQCIKRNLLPRYRLFFFLILQSYIVVEGCCWCSFSSNEFQQSLWASYLYRLNSILDYITVTFFGGTDEIHSRGNKFISYTNDYLSLQHNSHTKL